ncbi:hypothetical protein B0T22DRAFT_443002 [Podospora appendiculata]|uniref:Uncharacterized protein n=1 Tax=Podospora appendiculata TaxID=314037 RepID=A0AAE1CAS4_9PEZI|nr:hypothetical protein B0T22DRAFT_443002 [Podospora appendiculata]
MVLAAAVSPVLALFSGCPRSAWKKAADDSLVPQYECARSSWFSDTGPPRAKRQMCAPTGSRSSFRARFQPFSPAGQHTGTQDAGSAASFDNMYQIMAKIMLIESDPIVQYDMTRRTPFQEARASLYKILRSLR